VATTALPPPSASQQVASRPPASAIPEPVPGAPVAQITFLDNSARLSAADQRTLGDIVPLHQRNGGTVRVVGYAAKPRTEGAAQQLASFRMALERANAVATALTQAGVAPSQIAVEAAPPTDSGIAAQRAEIFLEN
jgi:outer membrane protein OmpA-like peptidoglycan-associated protein